MNVIRNHPRHIFGKRLIVGSGSDLVIKRTHKNEDFSEYLNPAASKVGYII
jgi:hypothetical protein